MFPVTISIMLTEGLILALLASVALTILGAKMKRIPILFIAALGWLISGLQVYAQTSEVLPMALLIMVAFSQFFLVDNRS